MLHYDNLSFAKVAGIVMSGAGLGLWKVARQPQLGLAVFAAGCFTTAGAGMVEMEHKTEEVVHKIEEGRPVVIIGGSKTH